jgi:beta-phosphoglucomutase
MSTAGLIFDFDGVVVLSEATHCVAWENLAREYGHELPQGFLESGIGRNDGELAIELSAIWNRESEATEILMAKRRCYGELSSRSPLVPGIKDALEHFSADFPLAVATSSCWLDIEPILAHHDLRRYFSAILTIDAVEKPKPHPEIYLKASMKIGAAPERCWVFEDSVHGATAARAAGSRVIGLTTTLPKEALSLAEAHFADFSDLEGIKRIVNGKR